MSLLLDTCVLSELIKTKPNEQVLKFFAQVEQQVYISSITLAELHRGVARLPESKRKFELLNWLNGIEQQYVNSILDFDRNTAKIWGELSNTAQRQGKTLALMDSMIAAITMQHQSILVTRNTKDFEYSGVKILNPWL